MIDLNILEEHIAIVSLNRPEAANAMSKPFLHIFNETIDKLAKNPSIYCTIITGAGEKAFCAGADLKERKGMSDQQVVEAVNYIGETITSVEKLPMPVIAALNGGAFGGGLELAIACDIRIAASHIKLGLTETSLAIIPGAGGTQRLPRLIGLGQAKRMIYTGKTITAEEALSIGLVEEIADGKEVLEKAILLARSIACNGPIALKQAKLAINRGIETDITTGLTIEHLAYKETIPTKDRVEGLQAFREKRKPIYIGE
ncbi:enoyl-CoA hydratase [Oceanobacillus halophilus]|uniref:Enoyl-CoA hydratase n=1 Tax=Oceanobacillus halophilus TaxID=930130 RepID=A0A495ACB1_9BACI|nr:enoyl-CoA hydratase [Oceanobacillus halophilus]RKQ37588.1 enoyl-CoA hydratase [Oceanobacillus halophilus]